MKAVLRLENITTEAGGNAVVDVTVNLQAGEIQVLPKKLAAAIIKIILGETKIAAGSGELLGYPLVEMTTRRRRELLRKIGVITPEQITVGELTLHDFLALPLKIAGMSFSLRSKRVKDTLNEFGLTIQKNQSIASLSTYDRRLATAAQALIKSPALVIGEFFSDEFDRTVIMPLLRKHALHGGSALAFGDNGLLDSGDHTMTEDVEFVPAR